MAKGIIESFTYDINSNGTAFVYAKVRGIHGSNMVAKVKDFLRSDDNTDTIEDRICEMLTGELGYEFARL